MLINVKMPTIVDILMFISMINFMLSSVEHLKKFYYLEVIKLEFILRLKIKRNDWLLADTCPQAANHCALIWVWDCTQVLQPWGQVLYGKYC